MNIVDYLALAFMGYGVWRGWQKGLGYELPSLISVAIFALTGFGVIRWTYKGLTTAAHLSPLWIGFLGAPFLFVGAVILVRHRLKSIQVWTEKQFQAPQQKSYGAAAGFLRTAIIAGFLIVYLGLLNVGFIHRTFAERSLFGRTLATWILPVYQTLFEKKEEKSKGAESKPAPAKESESSESGRIRSTSSKR